jgi:CRP-like cAMP-binding protein
MPTIDIFRLETEFQTFSTGQPIFNVGDHGDMMYAVIEGEVNIVVKGTVTETTQVGGIFGEMGVIDDSHTRSASAVAKTDCKLVAINRKRFMFLVQQTPFFAVEVMQIMAGRIRRNDQYIPLT